MIKISPTERPGKGSPMKSAPKWLPGAIRRPINRYFHRKWLTNVEFEEHKHVLASGCYVISVANTGVVDRDITHSMYITDLDGKTTDVLMYRMPIHQDEMMYLPLEISVPKDRVLYSSFDHPDGKTHLDKIPIG